MSPPSTADCIINHNNASPDLQAASSLLDAGDKPESAINLLLNTRLFTKSTDDDIEPIQLKWDSKSSDYKQRGPVVCNFYKKEQPSTTPLVPTVVATPFTMV